MRSLGSLVTSTICSVILITWNAYTFYDKFTTGNTYFWISGIIGIMFLLLFIRDMRDIIKKNYRTSTD
ncbi:hypothetical protein [Bacillus pseudomycoides]|uniref:Uncharacterized protein n=1 Tax=Bacillus pseudomycoides TaxID=64104 RepID=A0AAJ3REM7_9BACI|nr:hypothetical protein [Bacillus pseudomycoides]MDR4328925.1 hypothetical protein [Bacillus pseudomycoides]MED1475391.1 hypothetical protein [Bacillus pseudomycoides]MED1536429.1 hypothetical protein [Bacillus pseudomycoides]PEO91004.1 hypothetical protein CN571_07800 [Bacillus pseudomycoides]PFZ97224.1 hypothetical protein COL70_05145 [Bacillus pseudomycoides]